MAEVLKDKGYVFGLINLYPDPMKSSSVEGGFQGLLKKIVENVDELEAETLMYFMLRDPSKTRYCLLESYRNDDALNVHLTAEHNSQLFQELQSCFSQTPSGAMYNGMISGLSPDDKSHLGGVIWITSYDVKSGSEGEFQTICQELVQAYLQKDPAVSSLLLQDQKDPAKYRFIKFYKASSGMSAGDYSTSEKSRDELERLEKLVSCVEHELWDVVSAATLRL